MENLVSSHLPTLHRCLDIYTHIYIGGVHTYVSKDCVIFV